MIYTILENETHSGKLSFGNRLNRLHYLDKFIKYRYGCINICYLGPYLTKIY